jgi:hypothetical protein
MKLTTYGKLTHIDEDDDTNEFMFMRCYMYRLKWQYGINNIDDERITRVKFIKWKKNYNMDENDHETPYYWISSMDLISWMSSIFWHMHVNFIHVICFIIVITCFSNLTWLTTRKRGIDDNILFLYSTIVKNIILKKHLLSDLWTPIWNNIYHQILWWFFHVIHIFIKLNVCGKSNH